MDLIQGIILGVVQGLTEFLPVSSSGHLILAREVLGLETDFGLAVDAVLQLATALAVLVYFRRDWLMLFRAFLKFLSGTGGEVDASSRTLLWSLVAGTVPAVFFGLLLEDYMETAFRSALLVAGTLALGALLFIVVERLTHRSLPVTIGKAIVIGLFQSLALVPGLSRSGMTIAGGLLMGLSREEAARFGFLLSFPIIAGSGLKKLFELFGQGYVADFGLPLLVAFVASFVVGMAVIHWLLRYLRTHTLLPFAWYRLGLAALVAVLILI